jgi:2-polyprenyl-3-methyl-5-hydroxy-6-metoxy-1,4-benzoquinol methylase
MNGVLLEDARPGGGFSDAQCLACQKSLSGSDIIIDLRDGKVVACPSCRSWNYLPRPSTAGQIRIHTTTEYYHHKYFQKRREPGPQVKKRCMDVFGRLERHIPSRKLAGVPVLDIGCDTGSFIGCAADLFHIIPHGIDVSERAVEAASENGIVAYCGRLKDAPKKMSGYNLVTVVDVLEHVDDPELLLKEIHARLVPGGFVYIETPNPDSVIYTLGKWVFKLRLPFTAGLLQRLFPPQHLICFHEAALKNMATRCGFIIRDYNKRTLPYADIAVSPPLAAWLVLCQTIDRFTHCEILQWIILEKPEISH